MLLTGPFAMLSMPSFDFHFPPCTEGFLIHLSPLWQLPLWQLPLFPSVAQFPCVPLHVSRKNRWIAIWPMFVAEYFPQFGGNWKWLSVQSVRVHLHHYILGVEFQSFSDRFTVDPEGLLMRMRKSNNGNWSAWITVMVMYGLLGYNRMVEWVDRNTPGTVTLTGP